MKSLSRSNRSFNFPTIAILTLIFLILVSVFNLFITSKDTRATSISDFRAGNIISDSVFYNKDTMNVQQIQAFLDRQIGTCDTWGTGIAREWGSNLNRADFARSRGWHAPPYVCLNNYHENPNTKENSYTRGGGHFAGGISAAQIIYNASQQYNINPQVLLTILRKESAGPLTNDNWPLQSQYTYAMGWGCPDSGPGYSANCQGARAGFYNQMMTAAWQFNYYRENSNSYRYKLGWNDIQYAPDPACGTKRVNIENVATLSLYIYTPYTPNDASLRNYPGTAHCGSYGNRNFFMMFSNWFGSTQGSSWTSLKNPRIMTTSKETSKINPITGQSIQPLPVGQEIMFQTKMDDCLRTKHDTDRSNNACVNIRDLSEFNPTIQPLDSEGATEFRKIKEFTCKVDFTADRLTHSCFQPGKLIEFQSKTTALGVDYLITKHDADRNLTTAFRHDRLSDSVEINTPTPEPTNPKPEPQPEPPISKPVKWSGLVDPRIMVVANSDTYKINPQTGERLQKLILGQEILFSTKDDDCLRTKHDSDRDISSCVKISNLKEYRPSMLNLNSRGASEYMTVSQWTCKVDITRDRLTNQCFNPGTKIAFTKKIKVMGVDYIVTKHDSSKNLTTAFRADRFTR